MRKIVTCEENLILFWELLSWIVIFVFSLVFSRAIWFNGMALWYSLQVGTHYLVDEYNPIIRRYFLKMQKRNYFHESCSQVCILILYGQWNLFLTRPRRWRPKILNFSIIKEREIYNIENIYKRNTLIKGIYGCIIYFKLDVRICWIQ